MIIFSAILMGRTTKRKGYVEETVRLILTSNCQTLVALAMMQTVFFEMFFELKVAHYNGSSFRKYGLCKLSTAVETSTNMHYCLTLQFQK